MFTAVEMEWLKSFLYKFLLNGEYKNYVAYTIDNTSNNYNSDQYDFFVFISNEDIIKENLSYSTQGNFQLVKVDSSGASSNYKHARYVVEEGKGKTITINEYNHVFSNVDCLDADIISLETYKHNETIKFQETDYIYMLFIGSLMLINILHKAFTSAFPNRIGD